MTDVIAGVPLDKYAAVMAAVAEPFPLADVLAAEQLDADAWAEADLAWTERLVADAVLLSRYEVELAAAEDRLARAVPPLDGDVRAWVAFLAAVAAAAAPQELLAQNGLGVNDLSRLRRGWDRRMKADPALEKRAAELRKSGPGLLPRVRAAAPRLRPSTAGPRPASAPETQARSEVPSAPSEAPADPHPFAVKDAARLREHRRFATHLGLGPPPPPPPEVHRPEESTRVATLPGARELPFRVTPSRAFLEALEAPGAAPGDGSDGETVSLVGDLSELEILDEPDEAVPPSTSAELTATSVVSPFAERPLPFDAEPDVGPEQTVKMRAIGRAADESEAPTRVMPRRKLIADPETIPLDLDVDLQDALPFVAPRDLEDEATAETEAVRGEMSLERHAALCLEIAVNPSRADEVLAGYRVTSAEKERADQLYRRLVTLDPSLREAWNRAFEAHRAALARNRAR